MSTSQPSLTTIALQDANETINIVASEDPTASTTRRNRFKQRFSSRWRTLRGNTRSLIQGQRQYRPTSKRLSDSAKIADFRDWFDAELDSVVIEPAPNRAVRQGRHWTAPFVKELFVHGIRLADRYLEATGFQTDENQNQSVRRRKLLDPEIAVRNAPYKGVLQSLRTETYHDVEDAGYATLKDATRAYREYVRAGRSVNDTISAVNDRIDKVGRNRTDLVAEAKSVITINTAVGIRYAQAGVTEVGMAIETVPDSSDALAHCGCSQTERLDTEHVVASLQTDTGDSENDGDDTSWFPSSVAGAIGGAAGAQAIQVSDDGTVTVRGDVTEPEFSWATAGDNRVCPTCQGLAGNSYSLSDVLTGNAPMPVRSTHPRCRCVILPSS